MLKQIFEKCPLPAPWGLRSCGVNGIQSVPIAWANFDVRKIVNARKRKYWMLYSRRCGSSSAAVPAVWIRQSLVLWPGREREEQRIHPWYNSFYSLIKSSWCNSLFSSNHPGAIHPILQIILVQFIMFFKSSFSSNHPGAIRPILQIILVQFILFFKSSWCN